jgi:predicted GNAT family acetyltransferase
VPIHWSNDLHMSGQRATESTSTSRDASRRALSVALGRNPSISTHAVVIGRQNRQLSPHRSRHHRVVAIIARHTTDPSRLLADAGDFLRSRPVEHNVFLSILEARVAEPLAGRYWWVADDGAIVGAAFQSPLGEFAGLTPMGRAATEAMAETMASAAPDLPGVTGDAATAAAFAGTWAGLLHTPATPFNGQRLYRLSALVPPHGIPGTLRPASTADRDTLVRWTDGFVHETGLGHPGADVERAVEHNLRTGRVFIWDDDGAVSMALTRPPVAGVARVGLVYTPADCRGLGYASACVAALSAHVLATDAETCILYTQLANPTSNAIYRALGYEPVAEVLPYRFG